MRKFKKGFTIVELVIVIAVIAVLTAVLVPTFIHLTNKANKASDESLVTNLNKALAMREAEHEGKKPETMHEAVEDLKEYGFGVEQLVTKSGEKLVYDLKDSKFYLDGEGFESPFSGADKEKDEAHYLWRIQNDATVDSNASYKYSIYAGPGFSATEVELAGIGFDAGSKSVSSISYQQKVDSSSNPIAREVVIRTNNGNLTIDAESDKVHHYGEANVVDVQKIATSSYYEQGKVTFIKIAKGRVVVGDESEVQVGGIHVKANDVIVAVENSQELPAVSIDSAVTSFKLQTTNNEGAKQTESAVSVGESITTAATSGSTAVPVEVSIKVERTAEDKAEVVKTEEQAKESASEEVAPVFDEKIAARISTVGYETLKEALDSATAGQKVVMLKDVDEFPGYVINKSMTFDLGGHTLTGVTDFSKINSNCNNRVIKISGNTKVTIENGKIIATATSYVVGYNSQGKPINQNNKVLKDDAGGAGFFGAIRTENNASLLLQNITLENSRPWGMNVKITESSSAILRNVIINSRFGGGIEAAGGSTIIENCEFHQSEFYDWNSGCVAVSGINAVGDLIIRNTTMEIGESEYETCGNGNFGIYVYSSGGSIVVEGGTFSAIKDVIILGHDKNTYPDTISTVTINGGTFIGTFTCPELIYNDISYNNLYINGGTFNSDPSAFVDTDAYNVIHNSDGTWSVVPKN